jgi:hypothetical protein
MYGSKFGSSPNPFMTEAPVALTFADDAPECFDVEQSVDEGRRERRTHTIRTVAVIAARMVAAKAVVGPRIDLAVDNRVELAAVGAFL